jgi:tetratricopeptide (TPR) repeat protein
MQKLVNTNPAYRSDLAFFYLELGWVLSKSGELAAGLQAYEKSLPIWQTLVGENPAVALFQSEIARTHNFIGWVLYEMGKPADAMREQQEALTVMKPVADANIDVAEFQDNLALIYTDIGRQHAREKRLAEAFSALDQGQAILQKLVEARPKFYEYINDLGYSHAYRGCAHVRAGHPAEAAADLRRALALWEKGKAAENQTLFERGRAMALLAGLAADGKSGVTAAEAAAFADQAVTALRDAINAGCWAPPMELKEPDFDPLRDRDDFKKLLATSEAKQAAKPEKQP